MHYASYRERLYGVQSPDMHPRYAGSNLSRNFDADCSSSAEHSNIGLNPGNIDCACANLIYHDVKIMSFVLSCDLSRAYQLISPERSIHNTRGH